MAKLTNNDNETIEIATDEDVYIPIASTQTVGVAKFSPDDFAVSQDGQVTSLQKVGGIQYHGIIVDETTDYYVVQLSEYSDGDIERPKVNDKVMLIENYITTNDDGNDLILYAGYVYVITSVSNFDITNKYVYVNKNYLYSLKANYTNVISIQKTATEGLVDTYTIALLDGSTSTFTVTNGEQGEKGEQGDAGTSIYLGWYNPVLIGSEEYGNYIPSAGTLYDTTATIGSNTLNLLNWADLTPCTGDEIVLLWTYYDSDENAWIYMCIGTMYSDTQFKLYGALRVALSISELTEISTSEIDNLFV